MTLPRIKRLDVYIIKKFLGTFFYSIILIISIAIVFDFAERLDDFIDGHAPLNKIIFDYYLNFIPYFTNLFTSLFVFISVIFFTSKMAQNTEIIAILSSGISFKRFMRPYFISAAIIAVLSFVLSNFVIPHSNKKKIDFEYRYIRNPYRNDEINIHKQIEPGLFIYVENYSVESDIAYKFSMERFDNGHLVSKLISDFAQWDSTKENWKLNNYYLRTFAGDHDEIVQGTSMDITLKLRPEDFKRRVEIVETMDYTRLNQFIEEQKLEGSENIEAYLVQKYQRMINPLSIFVLTLIGLSVSSRKVRGGIGMHLGIGLLLSFSYILFLQISTNMSIGGTLLPILGVSIPTIIYSVVAIFLYYLTPK